MEKVREYLARFGKENEIIVSSQSTATVAEAAEAMGVVAGQIAKTLAFRRPEGGAYVIVYAGDARVQGGAFKRRFGCKPSMLSAEETKAATGYAPGGVCPFALPAETTELYLDVSLRRFATVYPACGTANNAICLSPDELYRISAARDWVDTAKIRTEEET